MAAIFYTLYVINKRILGGGIYMRKLTHEQFMEDFKTMNKHAQDIEILGTYINSRTKIKCKCKIDGYEWTPRPDKLLLGTGCPKCAGVVKPTTEEFIAKVKQINPNIEILKDYVNANTKIRCKCRIDGYEWEVRPYSLLNGIGCPKCGYKTSAQKQSRTYEEFINKLHKVNPNIIVLGDYINTYTKIKCKCTKCEHEWEAQPKNLLHGIGCPKCNTSKGEKRIAQYLDNLGIDYIYDMGYFKNLVSTSGRLLRPDFIIPSLKIWIEYDGEQHFEPVNFRGCMSKEQIQEKFEYIQQNDQIKDQYAKANNWILVRIPYYDYDNIEQILAAYLKQEQAV